MTSLISELRRIAQEPSLLVAVDFDGTLAPIASHPDLAHAPDEAIGYLDRLSRMGGTTVAVVSGRTSEDLRGRLPDGLDLVVVGSHGAELNGSRPSLDPELAAKRASIVAMLESVSLAGDGLWVETKPMGAALHYREAEEDIGHSARTEVLDLASTIEGVTIRQGKKVVEITVDESNKGTAIEQLRADAAVLYIGDDVTDEDAFAVLRPGDVGVKVGPEDSRARFRVASPENVGLILELVAAVRSQVTSSND